MRMLGHCRMVRQESCANGGAWDILGQLFWNLEFDKEGSKQMGRRSKIEKSSTSRIGCCCRSFPATIMTAITRQRTRERQGAAAFCFGSTSKYLPYLVGFLLICASQYYMLYGPTTRLMYEVEETQKMIAAAAAAGSTIAPKNGPLPVQTITVGDNGDWMAESSPTQEDPRSLSKDDVSPSTAATDVTPSYVFLHIPKCGGTSVRDRIVNVLQDQWNLQELTPGRLDELNTTSGEAVGNRNYWVNTYENGEIEPLRVAHHPVRQNIRLLAGHVAYGACNILPPPCHYITVLRDPRARLISEVRWIQHVFAHDASIANLTLTEFLERAVSTNRFCTLMDNHSTRLLSGDSYSEMFEGAAAEDGGRRRTPCLQLDQSIADRAIEHVTQGMFHAGRLEDLDDFFANLGGKFKGIDFGYTGARLNAASSKQSDRESDTLTPEGEALIKQLTRFDQQVYDAFIRSQ